MHSRSAAPFLFFLNVMCSLPCISLVLLPRWQNCNGAYLMLDWNNACTESLRAACEGFVDVSISSVTNPLRRERGRVQLFPRNSNWIPAASQPNQWSLCARWSEFHSPLHTALSVPCNPGPAIVSLPCYETLWTASSQWPLQPNLHFTVHLCLQGG